MSNLRQQANQVLNALDQGKIEGFINYQECLNPGIEKEQLKKSVLGMLELIKADPESIEYWMDYYFNFPDENPTS